MIIFIAEVKSKKQTYGEMAKKPKGSKRGTLRCVISLVTTRNIILYLTQESGNVIG